MRAMLGMAYFGEEKFADAGKTFSPLGVAGMQDSTVGYAWASSLARSNDPKRRARYWLYLNRQTVRAAFCLWLANFGLKLGITIAR